MAYANRNAQKSKTRVVRENAQLVMFINYRLMCVIVVIYYLFFYTMWRRGLRVEFRRRGLWDTSEERSVWMKRRDSRVSSFFHSNTIDISNPLMKIRPLYLVIEINDKCNTWRSKSLKYIKHHFVLFTSTWFTLYIGN